MKNDNKCEIKNCRNEFALTYIGKKLCDYHWEK